MNSVISSMNTVLKEWKTQYDLFHAVSYSFFKEQDMLYFASRPLCKADDLQLISADFDAESITFSINHNRVIEVHVEWPEDLPPAVTSVGIAYTL